MAREGWSIKACRYIKKTMFILCRYPAFPVQYIRDNINLPGTDPRELEDYGENSVTSKQMWASFLVFVYVSYTVKNMSVVYAWINSFDYENYVDNIKPLGYTQEQLMGMNYSSPAVTLKHISCSYTNCSRLGPAQSDLVVDQNHTTRSSMELVDDVGRLPILSLCYPLLERIYYTPATKEGAFGLFTFLVTIYTHMLLGSWTTMQQIVMPATNDLIMNITSPKATRNVMRRRACELLRDLAISLQNYCIFSIWSRKTDGLAPQLVPASTNQEQFNVSKGSDSDRQVNFGHGCRWRPSHLRQSRFIGASSLGTVEKYDGDDDTLRDRLVELTLRKVYFRGRSEREIRGAIENCMPVVCSEWWRPHLARILAVVITFMMLACLMTAVCVFVYVSTRISAVETAVHEFKTHMVKRNCSIWLETATSFTPDQALAVDQLNFSWDLFSVLDAITLNYISGVTGMLIFCNYWALIMHVSVWLAEMRMFIVASLLATRFQYRLDRQEAERDLYTSNGKRYDADQLAGYIGRYHFVSTYQFYNVPNLRQQFKESTQVTGLYAFKRIQRRDKWTYNSYVDLRRGQLQVFDCQSLNSKHSDRHYTDRFLAEILFPLPASVEHTEQSAQLFNKIDYDIETMEQIYINFRLLINYVRSLNGAMRVLMTVAYLLNYGYILVSIICRRKFNDLNDETIFLSVLAFMITNVLIYLGADFHANAKQLQPLLWSLIAQLTYSKNLRAQHLRSLWIKQTVNLDNDGGLALTAYGVPITYVFIIQLMIWTATIFVLALKPHGQEG